MLLLSKTVWLRTRLYSKNGDWRAFNQVVYDSTFLKSKQLYQNTMRPYFLVASILCLIMTGCSKTETARLIQSYEITLTDSSPVDTTTTNVTANRDRQGQQAQLISAFYGLDDALGKGSNQVICKGATGTDGMPVIFSHEIDVTTMQAGDFKVTTASGAVGEILCVTLAPADDPSELRTVLLAGAYGDIDDQPVKVEITGNLLSIDRTVNFKNTSVEVTPLEAGPTMVWAEVVPEDEWGLGQEASPIPWGGGNGCPLGTKQVVRTTWAGGVTKPGGDAADDAEGSLYKVTVLLEDSTTIEVAPFALADLGDGDNNHELCLDVMGTPQSIYFPAGYLTDPREDLNPETMITIGE